MLRDAGMNDGAIEQALTGRPETPEAIAAIRDLHGQRMSDPSGAQKYWLATRPQSASGADEHRLERRACMTTATATSEPIPARPKRHRRPKYSAEPTVIVPDEEDLGPCMLACTPKQRRFVLELRNGPAGYGSEIKAARAAGYGSPTSSDASMQGHGAPDAAQREGAGCPARGRAPHHPGRKFSVDPQHDRDRERSKAPRLPARQSRVDGSRLPDRDDPHRHGRAIARTA